MIEVGMNEGYFIVPAGLLLLLELGIQEVLAK
jgi:hypothetical protein